MVQALIGTKDEWKKSDGSFTLGKGTATIYTLQKLEVNEAEL